MLYICCILCNSIYNGQKDSLIPYTVGPIGWEKATLAPSKTSVNLGDFPLICGGKLKKNTIWGCVGVVNYCCNFRMLFSCEFSGHPKGFNLEL